MGEIDLRPATDLDRELVLDWRNDCGVRAASRERSEIAPREHAVWWEAHMADPDRQLLIAELAGEPVGQVRFEPVGSGAYELSVSLAAERRGRGFGSKLIAAGAEWLFANTGASRIEACVRPGNAASLAAFERAGFRPIERQDPDGLAWLALECDLSPG